MLWQGLNLKEKLRTFVDWLAIGASLLWLAALGLLFSNSMLAPGWSQDAGALVAFGLAAIWAIWWLLRGILRR
jgi:hypothetical protein